MLNHPAADARAPRAPVSALAAAPAPRRIVVNGRFLAQRLTGVQRYGVETLRALDRLLSREPHWLREADFQLAVPCGADVPLLENFEIHTLPALRGHAWEQVTLARFARDAELLNFSYSGPLFKRSQLITLHDAGTRADRDSYSWRYRWAHDALAGWLAGRVQTVMTVSEFSRRDIARHLHLPAQRLLVGREGGEHAVARGDTVRQVRRLGLVPGRYLLAVGSRKASKNLGLIGRALELMPDIRCPVAVAGASDAGIFQGAQPASRSFRLLGYVDDADLFALYRHAAWFILPSRYEGFGLPALEAMANGCPVLAARAASLPEVCGDAALYFDPEQPAELAALLRRVLNDPTARHRLASRAAQRLEIYRWDENARILWQQLFPPARAAAAAAPAAEPAPDARPALGLDGSARPALHTAPLS
jgi:glycosyltransferase involved in cell wall biosynthesis